MLRKTRRSSDGQNSSYFRGWQEYEKNPYHPMTNPKGIIQMGLAENQLSFDLLESWLQANPGVAGFENSSFRDLALFQDYNGLPAFKIALARFMGEIRGSKVKVDPNNIVLTAGATSANEILMFCLAEPGDAFLLPTPYYPGFDRDLKWRTGVEIVPVRCSSSDGFRLTLPALEQAYDHATDCGLRVRGVLVTNPSNPLGTTATPAELATLLEFVNSKSIHLISDEIYAGTVFRPPGFTSLLGEVSDRVHVVYSLSKDLGLPGFRVGLIHSRDAAVVDTATKMSSFGLVSSHTQHFLSSLLSDEGFARGYMEENRRRLRERHGMLVQGLRSAGVECLESNAGLFCWVDLRPLLRCNSMEGEMELWKELLYDVGLNISPGSSCHCEEPGWFRVCFANMEEETLGLALKRVAEFVRRKRTRGEVATEMMGGRGGGGGGAEIMATPSRM